MKSRIYITTNSPNDRHSVQSSAEKAAEDLFQMYEAVKEEKHREDPRYVSTLFR